ncbi:MAG: GNAT family N-acetyltransferase [Thermomicrobiales bacterium]
MSDGAPLVPEPHCVEALDPRQDEAVAREILAADGGSVDEARAHIASLRADPSATLSGIEIEGSLAAVIAVRKAGMTNEIALLAVAPDHRQQGLAKRCLRDALRRSGRRPLAVEADEACAEFYKACGFKIVGRRPTPDGGFRYRLGWHAPRPKATGPPQLTP